MASIVYNTWKGKDGNDWAAGADAAYKVMLVTSSYVPNPDHDHPNASGLAANEIAGGTYARQNVANRTKTKNDTTNAYEHAADNVLFEGLTGPATPKYAIVLRVVNDDTDHQLVCCVDLGDGHSITGQFRVRWDDGETSGVVFEAQ